MDWIVLAQGRDKWRALVKVVMNLLVPQNVEKFLSVGGLLSTAQLHKVS
jgi:hypothetical protein